MRRVAYDAAPLIAADRGDRRIWAEHRARLELGIVPLVPAPVVAQVSRSPRQATLRRFLRGCEVVPLDETAAHGVGALLGKSHTTDLADAALVRIAASRGADIVTADRADIEHLAAALRAPLRVLDP